MVVLVHIIFGIWTRLPYFYAQFKLDFLGKITKKCRIKYSGYIKIILGKKSADNRVTFGVHSCVLSFIVNTKPIILQESKKGLIELLTRKNLFNHGFFILLTVIYIFSFWLCSNQQIFAEKDSADLKGQGTEGDPFVIYTFSGLEMIGTDGYPLDAYYKLGRDIDAAATKDPGYNYGRGWTPFGEIYDLREKEWQGFSGVFDGQGYTISNLYLNIDYHNNQAAGLFLVIEDQGVIKNINFKTVEIKSNGPVGGLCAYNYGRIEDVTVSGKLKGLIAVGGLVGSNEKDGSVINSFSSVDVEGFRYIGGLIGINKGKVSSSCALGRVVGMEPSVFTGERRVDREDKSYGAGGLVGLNYGQIEQSCATGDINGNDQAGGLVGINGGLIENSYATGNIKGAYDVGGLVGENRGSINKTYAVGRVSGVYSSTKGIAGNNDGVENSFYRVGMGGGYISGEGRSILELKQEDGYRAYDYEDDWDFEDIWTIEEGQSYPYLRNNPYCYQRLPGTKKMRIEILNRKGQPHEREKYNGPDITGSGTEEDPFLIYSFSGLEKIGTKGYPLDGYYKLARNIDAGPSGNQDYNNGMGWDPIGEFNSGATYIDIDNHKEKKYDWSPFTGVFDGQGFMVSNLFIYRVNSGCVGLFSALDQGGIIQNVNLVNVNIKGGSAGGLVGYNRGLIQGCTLTGLLESNGVLGGLVSINEGDIVGSDTHIIAESLGNAGGLVGINYGELKTCSSRGMLEANIDLGGLVGENHGIIKESTSSADVVGDLYIGGLVGDNEGGDIIECIAEGEVKGFERGIGNLYGINRDGNIVDSYAKNDHESIEKKEDPFIQMRDKSDHILWQIELGTINTDLGLSPDGKRIYVISDDNFLYAVNSEGKIEWSSEVRWNYINPLVGADGIIYIVDDQGVSSRLYALKEDGSTIWSLPVGNATSHPVRGEDGTIYITNAVDGVIAVNPDGSKKWTFKIAETYVPPAVAGDGTVCVGGYTGLYGINPDGSMKWRWDYLHDSDENSYTDPAISGEGFVYFAEDDKLFALVPDGTVKWVFRSEGRIHSKPAISKDGTIYVGSADGHLYALENSGVEKWSIKFAGAIQGRPVPGNDGTVYIGTNNTLLESEDRPNGNVYAIDSSGRVKWSIDTGPITSSGVLSTEGILYYGSADGFLYAIGGLGSQLHVSKNGMENKVKNESRSNEERVTHPAEAEVADHEAANAIHILKKLYEIKGIDDLPEITISGEEEFGTEVEVNEEKKFVHIYYQTDFERHKPNSLSVAAGLPGEFFTQAEAFYHDQVKKYGPEYYYILEGALLGGTLAQYAGIMSEGFVEYFVRSYNGIGLENLLVFRGNEFFGYKTGIWYYLEGNDRSRVVLERLKKEGVIKDGNISYRYRRLGGSSLREDKLKAVLVKVVREELNYTSEEAERFVEEAFDPIIVQNKMRLIERYKLYKARHESTGSIENYLISECILGRLLKNGVGKTYIVDDDLKMKDLGMEDEFRQYIEELDEDQINALLKTPIKVFSPFVRREEEGNGKLALNVYGEKPTLHSLTNNLSMDYLRTLIKDIVLDLQMKDEDFVRKLYEYTKKDQEIEVVKLIIDRLKHSVKIQHKAGMVSDCEFTSDYFKENAHLFTDADKVYFWDKAVIEQFRNRMYLSEIYQLWDWEETEQGIFLILGTKGEYLIDYSISGLDDIVDNSPIKLEMRGGY